MKWILPSAPRFRVLALLAAAASAVGFAALVGVVEPAEAAFPGQNGDFVYWAHEAPCCDGGEVGDAEIYTIPATGGTSTQVTNNSIDDNSPAFSPDGKTIAYSAWVDNDYDIYTIPATGGTPTQVTNDDSTDALNAAWSPDGSTIVYDELHAPFGSDSEIYTVPASGGTPTQLTHNTTRDDYPSWSPDGTRIAYRHCDGDCNQGREQVYTIPATGGTPTQVINTLWGTANPNWSPDGTKIAYVSAGSSGAPALFTIPSTGGTPSQVTNLGEGVNGLADMDWGVATALTGPKSKAECKKGGYKDFGFKTQGKCIRFVKEIG